MNILQFLHIPFRSRPTGRNSQLRIMSALSVAAFLLASPSGLDGVGALASQSSTVYNNPFGVGREVNAGIHNLHIEAAGGTFGNDESVDGAVSFQTFAQPGDTISLRRGDVVSTRITLPAGFVPNLQPAGANSDYRDDWSYKMVEGRAEVIHRYLMLRDATTTFGPQSFGVTATLDGVIADEDFTVRAEIELPTRFFTTNSAMERPAPVTWTVETGVYNLAAVSDRGEGMAFEADGAGVLTFSSHPSETRNEAMHLRTDDVISTTVTLPIGIVPGDLPTDAPGRSGSTVAWESGQNESGAWVVERRETFTSAQSTYNSGLVSFPVTAAPTPEPLIRATTTLPDRFISLQPEASAEAHIDDHAFRFTSISAGTGFTLAIANDGETYAWGVGGYGQLGIGDEPGNQNTPVRVLTPDGVRFIEVSAGDAHSLAIGDDGKTYAWGSGASGRLGNNTSSGNQYVPVEVQVAGDTRLVQISAGGQHSLAIGEDGYIYSWGTRGYGQLGNEGAGDQLTAQRVSFSILDGATLISAGHEHSVAVAGDGKTYAWGAGTRGRLGNGISEAHNHVPAEVRVPEGMKVISLAAGRLHTLAIGSGGDTYAWGAATAGQLGNNSTTDRYEPVRVQAPNGVTFTAIAAGYQHSLATGSDGNAYAWGLGSSGELGTGTTSTRYVPSVVSSPEGVTFTSTTSSDLHSVAIGDNGQTYAWGAGTTGQLGNGQNGNRLVPTEVSLPAR